MGLLNANNSYLYYSQEMPDYFIYLSINNDINDIIITDDLEELTNARTINDNTRKISKEKEKLEINNNIKIDNKKFLGRKRKGDDSKGKHDKFYDDNTIKRIKRTIITELKNFINVKIENKLRGEIGEDMFKKEIMLLNEAQIVNTSIEFNKEFLSKILKDIFSENISNRIANYPKEHNKNLINKLINDENEERSNYFKELFNISFYDCLKYFRGDNIDIELLEGFTRFSDIEEEFKKKDGEEYTNHFKEFLQNYKEIITYKKPKRQKINKAEILLK